MIGANHRSRLATLLTVVLTVAFNSLGTAGQVRGIDPTPPPPPPPPLTEIATRQILRNLSVSTLDLIHAFTLSPNQLYVPDKGKLWFVNPDYVITGATPSENRASFPATQTPQALSTGALSIRGEMLLALKAGANQRYIVDCSVSNKSPGGRKIADFSQQQTTAFILEINGQWKEKWPVDWTGGQHLVFALQSASADWYQVGIYSEVPWIFYSCRVMPR